MRSKKLLVIGAGLAQADAIRRAKELGYHILASDGSAYAEGLALADESRVIDVKDAAGNLDWARAAGVDGVLSYASDITLPTVQAVREAMGLPGLSRLPMEISLNKAEQRRRFEEAGLAQPDFEEVRTPESASLAARRLGLPLVLKPVDNAGSRGVTVVENAHELASSFQLVLDHSHCGSVIIEEFMDGLELTVEGFSVRGEHHILAVSDKFKPEGSYRVATQLAYPAAIPADAEMRVVELMRAAYTAAGVDNTPTHSEVILTREGPKIVEISCRGGGFYVFSRVVQAASGYDIVGNWTRLCAGDPVEPVCSERRGVALRFYAPEPGRLVRVEGLEKAQAMEGVMTGLFLKPGEIIPELKTDGSRTGWMITRGTDRAQAVGRADEVSRIVGFFVEKADA